MFKTSNDANVQEEADRRVFLHELDMRRHSGILHVIIKTVDTDVVVLAVVLFSELNFNELWIEFRSQRNQVYYTVYAIYNSLGTEKPKGLWFFHAFAGCDQTSFFANCRKKSTQSTWCNSDDATETFIKHSSISTIKAVKDAMPMLERFIVLMYHQIKQLSWYQQLPSWFICEKGGPMEALPPIFAALPQHSFRAAYQA